MPTPIIPEKDHLNFQMKSKMNEVLSDKEKECLTYQFLYSQYHHVDSP